LEEQEAKFALVMSGNDSVAPDELTTFDLGAIVIIDAMSLPLVLLVIVFDLLLIAASIVDSRSVTVRSIRLILVNILVASVVGATGSVLRHGFQVSTLLDSSIARYLPNACKVYLPVISIGGTGRMLMDALYAFTVFIVVRCWYKPVLAPRNTKYFIITAVIVWILIILLSAPFFVLSINPLCDAAATGNNTSTATYATLIPNIFIFGFPIIFTLLLLVITVCFIKRRTITESTAARKALLKFGFFLLIGQGINAIGQMVSPAVFIALSSNSYRPLVVTMITAIFDLSLIPAPILIYIFFKPVQLILRKWFCRCCARCSVEVTVSTQGTTHAAHTANNFKKLTDNN